MSCRVLNFTLTYAPLSLFRWQLYAAQGMRNQWTAIFGEDYNAETDEEQDSLKVDYFEKYLPEKGGGASRFEPGRSKW